MSNLRKYCIFVLTAVLFVSTHGVKAQSGRTVRWLVQVPDGDIVPNDPRTFRIYDTPDQLTLTFMLAPESGDGVLITRAAMTRNVRCSLQSQVQTPLAATWDARVRTSGLGEFVTAPDADVRMDATGGSQWTVTLRRADGQTFEPGRNDVLVSLPDGLRGARDDSGAPWNGRLLGTQMTVSIILGSPSSDVRERAAALGQIARHACTSGQLENALAAYRSAVALDGGNPVLLVAAGEVCLRLGRYSEAIPLLSVASRLVPAERSPVHEMLARGYLGVGDEVNARLVLRNSGISPARVSPEILRLRDLNNRPNLR